MVETMSVKDFSNLKKGDVVHLLSLEELKVIGDVTAKFDGDSTSYVYLKVYDLESVNKYPTYLDSEYFDKLGKPQVVELVGKDSVYLEGCGEATFTRRMMKSPINDSRIFNKVQECETSGSAGFDIKSSESITIEPNTTSLVHTGLYFSKDFRLKPNEWLGIYSRSGLALKKSVFVLNSPGVVDSDYDGEICVILHNSGNETFTINVGDRIAQGIISEHLTHKYVKVKDTERSGGFGSTDK